MCAPPRPQEYTKEERAALAARSRASPPQFGSTERQRVTDEVHADMLAAEARQAPGAAPDSAAAKSGGAVLAKGDASAGSANPPMAQALESQAQEASSAPCTGPPMQEVLPHDAYGLCGHTWVAVQALSV